MKKFTLSALVLLLAAFSLGARDYVLISPDGSLKVRVTDGEQLVWSVTKDTVKILEPGVISLEVKDHGILGDNVRVERLSRIYRDRKLTATVPTKFREIRDNYNEMALRMKGGWSLVFRAYDN